MAVFHLKVSVGSREGGQSACAKADYIEREGRYEQDREELEHRESENMPEWVEEDPRSYWEAADEHERANGSLFREIQFALPRELNEQERRELASGFARRLTEGERLPYTLAIHRGGPDGGNPHAHLMVSERGLDGHERSREQWFRRYNAKAPEKGGGEKEPHDDVARVGERHPRGMGEGDDQGAGAGGGAEPGAERASRPGGVSGGPGRGIGDGPKGGARGRDERSRAGRAGRLCRAGGSVGAGDRRA